MLSLHFTWFIIGHMPVGIKSCIDLLAHWVSYSEWNWIWPIISYHHCDRTCCEHGYDCHRELQKVCSCKNRHTDVSEGIKKLKYRWPSLSTRILFQNLLWLISGKIDWKMQVSCSCIAPHGIKSCLNIFRSLILELPVDIKTYVK